MFANKKICSRKHINISPKPVRIDNPIHWGSKIKNKLNKAIKNLYTSNGEVQREIKKDIPFIVATKFKYLGINLTKEVKGLYNENHKMLMKYSRM